MHMKLEHKKHIATDQLYISHIEEPYVAESENTPCATAPVSIL